MVVSYGMLRAAALLAGSAFASTSVAQSDAVCMAALEHGTTKYEAGSSLSKVSSLYHTFCRTEIEHFEEARERASKAGLNVYEVFDANYKSKDIKTQTRDYFQTYCSDLKSFDSLDATSKLKFQGANATTERLLQQCKKQAGIVSWVEYTPDPRRFTVHFEYHPVNITGNASPKVRFQRRHPQGAIELDPRVAFVGSKCANEPNVNSELTLASPRSISCSVDPNWAGSSVSVSAELKASTGAVIPQLVHVSIPRPKKAAPKADPQLVLLESGRVPLYATLGEWLQVDLRQPPSKPLGWRSMTSPSFTLRILDADEALGSGEVITAGMLTRQWIHNHYPQTNKVTSGQALPILAEKVLTDAPTATFGSFTWVVGPRGIPDNRTGEGSGQIQIDATKAKSIGVQAQFTSGCVSDPQTTSPGGKTIQIDVPRTTETCILRLRLCSTPTYAGHDAGSSCTRVVAPAFAANYVKQVIDVNKAAFK